MASGKNKRRRLGKTVSKGEAFGKIMKIQFVGDDPGHIVYYHPTRGWRRRIYTPIFAAQLIA